MALGILSAFAVVLASIAIPGIHLVATIPVGPFIGGFIGSSVAKATDAQVLVFGMVITGLSALPIAALIVWALLSSEPLFGLRSDGLLITLAVLLLPYIWFSVTLGALLNYLLRRRQAKGRQE